MDDHDMEAMRMALAAPKPQPVRDPSQFTLGLLTGMLQVLAQPAPKAPKPLSSQSAAILGTPVVSMAPCDKASAPPSAAPKPKVRMPPFSFRLQLWNVRDLGGGPAVGPERSDAAIEAIARVIHHGRADVTAILEVHRTGFNPGAPKLPDPVHSSIGDNDYFTALRSSHAEYPRLMNLFRTTVALRAALAGTSAEFEGPWVDGSDPVLLAGRRAVRAEIARVVPAVESAKPDFFYGTDQRSGQYEAWLRYWYGHQGAYESPPPDWGIKSAASSSSAFKGTASKDKKGADHKGFREIIRILNMLNALAGADVYAVFPTPDQVVAMTPPKPAKGEKAKPHPCYTEDDAYAFIYRQDRVRPQGQIVELLRGFKGRAPGRATFVAGNAEIDVIAHHAPAESTKDKGRAALRAHDLKVLGATFANERKRSPPRIVFYAADSNIDTQSNLGEAIFQTNGAMTKQAYLEMLSDDPRYPKSRAAIAQTSIRETEVEESATTRLQTGLGLDARAAAATSGAALKWRKRDNDPYETRYKAFDKITVVAGAANHWVETVSSTVVPLLHAVAPPSAFSPSGILPELSDDLHNSYRAIIGGHPQLLEDLCGGLSAPKSRKLKRPTRESLEKPTAFSAPGARGQVLSLVHAVRALSDHYPVIAEFRITLPADYPAAAKPSSAKPVLLPWPPPSSFGGTSSMSLAPDAFAFVDGAPGQLTPAVARAALGGVGTLERVACLAQDWPSCGARAVWNARNFSRYYNDDATRDARIRDHAYLYERLEQRDGTLMLDAWDDDVTRMMGHANIGDEVVFLGHFGELASLDEIAQDAALERDADDPRNAWEELRDVRDRVVGALAILIINTLGNSDVASGGYGHYIAVKLAVRGDQGLDITYADSLEHAPSRAGLLRALVHRLDNAGAAPAVAAPLAGKKAATGKAS